MGTMRKQKNQEMKTGLCWKEPPQLDWYLESWWLFMKCLLEMKLPKAWCSSGSYYRNDAESPSQSTWWGEVENAGDRQAILSNNKRLCPPGPPSFLRIHLLFPGQLETPKVRSLQGCETWFFWFLVIFPVQFLAFSEDSREGVNKEVLEWATSCQIQRPRWVLLTLVLSIFYGPLWMFHSSRTLQGLTGCLCMCEDMPFCYFSLYNCLYQHY